MDKKFARWGKRDTAYATEIEASLAESPIKAFGIAENINDQNGRYYYLSEAAKTLAKFDSSQASTLVNYSNVLSISEKEGLLEELKKTNP